MRSTSPLAVVSAPLHDELVLEAGIALRDAIARIEGVRANEGGPHDVHGARREALALVADAQQLLHRAELAAADVDGTPR